MMIKSLFHSFSSTKAMIGKMSERKVIFIVLFGLVCFLLTTLIPDWSSSSSNSSSSLNSNFSPQPSDQEEKSHRTSNHQQKKNPSHRILAADPAPKAPIQTAFKHEIIHTFDPATTTCGSSSSPSLFCGCSIANTFGLQFKILEQKSLSSSSSSSSASDYSNEGSLDYQIVIGQAAGNTSDLSFSSIAFSDTAMVGAVPRQLSHEEISNRFGSSTSNSLKSAFEFNFWLPYSKSEYELEITLTWINDLYIGQKWFLPNRDDNPPTEMKKQKCLDLKLKGENCERFGLSILKEKVKLVAFDDQQQQQHPLMKLESHNQQQESKKNTMKNLLCKTHEEISSQGAWYKIKPEEFSTVIPNEEERNLLDDFVGLNRFQGGIWKWQPRNCILKWFSRNEAIEKLVREKKIKQITLFGDSMLLEQFHNFKKLLAPDAGIRSRTQNKMRTMTFVASSTSSASTSPSSVSITFLRSYTTSKGKSVIASPKVIANQVAATRPDIILGNAAVLHWQQNMRSFEDWNGNINVLAKSLCSIAAAKTRENTADRKSLFYFGPTLIQMGRTQGLQPHRTTSFGDAARDAFMRECGGGDDGDKGNFFAPFWMYNASISRRTSAFDGQHWGCYREFGGVAQTFTQMFLNMLLN